MMKQKKILLLGGSAAQLIAIKKAKELGLYSIVCDYLPDNPGQYIADKFYLESTTNKEGIYEIAKKEKIDGIVAYSSDPAAPTAAFVANKLGLPGHDYNLVCQFCEKQLFRKYLKKNGFNIPQSIEIQSGTDVKEIDLSNLQYPIVIKPTDSSGSKGITVIQNTAELEEALVYAAKYSRNRVLIAEEFIQRDHPNVIEAEIFVVDGQVISWGLFDSIRDFDSNPLLPAGYSYPLDLPANRISIVKNEIARLIKSMGTPSGAFNLEMIIDKNDNLYFLDAGPRNGGNMLPEWISMISGKDIVKATLLTVLGEPDNLDVEFDGNTGGFWGMGVLHSSQNGILEDIEYSLIAKKALKQEIIHYKKGDTIRKFDRCDDLIGLNFLHFESKKDMETVMKNMCNSMKIIIR